MNVQSLIPSILRPIPGQQFVFFNNNDIQSPWQCLGVIGNGHREFHPGEQYSLYQISALMRVLCLKNMVITEVLARKLYDKQTAQLCRVLDWLSLNHKVVIVRFNVTPTEEQLHQTQKILSDTKLLENIFATLLVAQP